MNNAPEPANRVPDVAFRSGEAPRVRGLALARAAWVAIAVLGLASALAGTWAEFRRLRVSPLIHSGFAAEWSDPAAARAALAAVGVPLDLYAAWTAGRGLIAAAFAFAIAFLVFRQRARDAGMLLLATSILFTGTANGNGGFGQFGPVWQWLDHLFIALTSVGGFLLFYLFPDGRFVPRWTRWATPLGIGLSILVFLNGARLEPGDTPLPVFLVALFLVLSLPFSQVYRYLRVSGPLQRQQTKVALFGLLATPLTWAATAISTTLLRSANFPLPEAARWDLLLDNIFFIGYLMGPLGIGIAVLRYRLWDIELLIRRTLIYSVLTGALVGVYFGVVVVLQGLLRSVTGATQNELVTVISTLTIAALSIPLRNRIQRTIDRRFYRRKYDAVKTLAAFGATARDEVDIERLSAQLVAVVQDTMEPSSVGLWLRAEKRHPPSDLRPRIGESPQVRRA